MKTNRRIATRYFPKANSFAALGHRYSKIGRLKDISLAGLAFEYIAGNEDAGVDTSVDVFLTHDPFHLHDVPCEVVYDIPVAGASYNRQTVGSIVLRRSGLRFLALDDDQRQLLQLFTDRHITGK